MGNYELLTSVHPSCKNSLQREIHFRSDASRPGTCGLGESGEQEGEALYPAQPCTPGPQPRCAQGGWVSFFFMSFLLRALLICLIISISLEPQGAIEL